MSELRTTIAILLVLGIAIFAALPAGAQGGIVRAVLFYSPTCPHCHKVMTEDLPPLMDQYGEQLQIVAVDTTKPGGADLFHSAMAHFDVPQDQYFVPALAVGETLLVGSADIPAQFPGIIDSGLAAGGIPWPAIPGLQDVIGSLSLEPEGETPAGGATPEATATSAQEEQIGNPMPTSEIDPRVPGTNIWDRFQLDPIANGVAVIVLIGMLVVLGIVLFRWIFRPAEGDGRSLSWLVPILSLIGACVAAYLTYIETTETLAVCGPVGDCNAVQGSQYARLFGILPVGLFGLFGYLAILGGSLYAIRSKERNPGWPTILVFGLALFGTLFSIYLTFLEPFVIGATCSWCLTSAVLITGIFWLTSDPAKHAVGAI
jgi:uncharacterized membrane protein/thiol-disulfide isomerase/thioredoxin